MSDDTRLSHPKCRGCGRQVQRPEVDAKPVDCQYCIEEKLNPRRNRYVDPFDSKDGGF